MIGAHATIHFFLVLVDFVTLPVCLDLGKTIEALRLLRFLSILPLPDLDLLDCLADSWSTSISAQDVRSNATGGLAKSGKVGIVLPSTAFDFAMGMAVNAISTRCQLGPSNGTYPLPLLPSLIQPWAARAWAARPIRAVLQKDVRFVQFRLVQTPCFSRRHCWP